MAFSIEDMRRFALEAWGPFGAAVVDRWVEYNGRYFDNALRPVPLVLTHTQPFGRRLAFCSYAPSSNTANLPSGRTITLNVPSFGMALVADNSSLLHEMIHQYLNERGEDPRHAGDGWRREIMRLHQFITGDTIWAGKSQAVRQKGGGVVRICLPNKETGQPSLTQGQIAHWPHEPAGAIELGPLGSEITP